ncbi:MAG: hypothetical protein ABIR30_01280 [Chitinophagaceae bacterium]
MKPSISTLTFLVLFPFLFSNCKQEKKRADSKKEIIFFDPIELGAFNQSSNVSIDARFSECGEWGGHTETIILTADKEQKLYATYKVYPFNCDSLDHYYKNKNLMPAFERKIILTDKSKQSISNYIHRLTQSKITQRFSTSNANNIFSIANSDSSLFILVYGSKEYEVLSFKKLTSELFK